MTTDNNTSSQIESTRKTSVIKTMNNIYNPIIHRLKEYKKKASQLKIPGVPESEEFDFLINSLIDLKEEYKRASKKIKKSSDTKSGFAQPVFVTHKFSEFCNNMNLGVKLPLTKIRYSVLTRSLITKIITYYIESNKLKHLEHKRYIICDDVLQKLFGKKLLEDFYETHKDIQNERKSVVKKFDIEDRKNVICFSWSGLQKLACIFVVDIPVEPKTADTRRINKIFEFFANK